MKLLVVTITILSVSSVYGRIDRLADCLNQNGEDLDKCHSGLGGNLRDIMKKGDSANGINQVDPMSVDVLNFVMDDAGINIKAKYTENIIKGMSDFSIKSFRTNTKRKLLFIELETSRVTAAGKYDFDGTAAVVDLDRSFGDYSFELRDSTIVIVANLENAGGNVAIVNEPRLSIKVGTMKVQMKNLFNGEAPQFAEVVHKFINNNPDRFLDAMLPPIRKQIGDAVKKYYRIAARGVDPALYGY